MTYPKLLTVSFCQVSTKPPPEASSDLGLSLIKKVELERGARSHMVGRWEREREAEKFELDEERWKMETEKWREIPCCEQFALPPEAKVKSQPVLPMRAMSEP